MCQAAPQSVQEDSGQNRENPKTYNMGPLHDLQKTQAKLNLFTDSISRDSALGVPAPPGKS